MDIKYSLPLSKLLSDVELFLMNKLNDIELSTDTEEKRKELLKDIEIFRQLIPPSPDEYMEMNGNLSNKETPGNDAADEQAPEYVNGFLDEDVDGMCEKLKDTHMTSGICNDYGNEDILPSDELLGWPPVTLEEPSPLGQINLLSAPALKAMALKCGPLQRKDRFMFMDQFRRVWVGLHGHHLYFYSSDKDNKPQNTLDISDYKVRHAPETIKDSKKKPLCFEIMCPRNKAQQFIARSFKDMEQWIAAIKKAKSNIQKESKNTTYDDAADTKTQISRSHKGAEFSRCTSDDSEYAIYHDIQDGMFPENLYDDAAGPHGKFSSYEEETYDDVGAWRERLNEEEIDSEDKVINKLSVDEMVVKNGITLPVGSGRIRQLVRFMEEEGVIKTTDECGRRRDEGGGKQEEKKDQ